MRMYIRITLCTVLMSVVTFGQAIAPPVTDGLQLHFSADALTLEPGDGVTEWPDLSGFNRHATGGNGGATFEEKTTRGEGPSVAFHASWSEALRFRYNPNEQDITVLAVSRSRMNGGGWPLYHTGFVGWGEAGGHGLVAPGGFHMDMATAMFSGYGPGGPGHFMAVTYEEPVTDFTVNTARLDSEQGFMDFYLNGELLGELTDIVDPVKRAQSEGTIGGLDFNNGLAWAGDLAELLVFNRALTNDEVNDVEAYLYDKWLASEKATHPQPADGATHVNVALLRWEPGDSAVLHQVYFGDNPDLGTEHLVQSSTETFYLHPHPLAAGSTHYWRVDEVDANDVVTTGNLWQFTMRQEQASQPQPSNGALWIDVETDLAWSAGAAAIIHHVYFGRNEADVAAGTGNTYQGAQIQPNLALDTLAAETVYYWRVDEEDPSGQVHTGPVWYFTTDGQPGGLRGNYYANMDLAGDPVLTRLDETVDFDWGVNAPDDKVPSDQFSVRWTGEIRAAFAEPHVFILGSDDGSRLYLDGQLIVNSWREQGYIETASKPINLEPGRSYSVVVEYFENGGDAHVTLQWESPSTPRRIIPSGALSLPVTARRVFPPEAAVDVSHDVVLEWLAGETAQQHDIYLGTNYDDVAQATTSTAGIYQKRVPLNETQWQPGGLAWNTTYYWRIDEINNNESGSPWKGPVWSFTTADFVVIDDFEAYADQPGKEIYNHWWDGYGGDTSLGGSTSGHLTSPTIETSTVHSGEQAWPLYYDNDGEFKDYNGNPSEPTFSSSLREFIAPQNWKQQGGQDLKTLALYVHGQSGPKSSHTYDTVKETHTVVGTGRDIWEASDQFVFVYKPVTGDTTMIARLESVTHAHAWAKVGVMIRDSLDPDASYGMGLITPENRASFQRRSRTGNETEQYHTEAERFTLPHWIRIQLQFGAIVTVEHSADGTNWENMDGVNASGFVSYTGENYVGFAVTSHVDENTLCEAVFSQVDITNVGNEPFEVANIGLNWNTPDTLSLTVKDSRGGMGVFPHPDNPNAIIGTDWQAWFINLADIQAKGVDLQSISSVRFDIGEPGREKTAGTGMVFIDDLRLHSEEIGHIPDGSISP